MVPPGSSLLFRSYLFQIRYSCSPLLLTLPAAQVASELASLGVAESAVEGILAATKIESIEGLAEVLGEDNPAVKELRDFFQLAEAAGCRDYLEFDPSVVRGLAYYTGMHRECLLLPRQQTEILLVPVHIHNLAAIGQPLFPAAAEL